MKKLSIIFGTFLLFLLFSQPAQAQTYSSLTPEKLELFKEDVGRVQGYISGLIKLKEVNRDSSVEVVNGKVYSHTASKIEELIFEAGNRVALQSGAGKEVFLPKSGKLKPSTIISQWEAGLPQIEVRLENSANTLTFAAQDSLGGYYLVSNITLDDDLPKEILNDPTRFFVKYGGKIYEVVEGKQVFIRYIEKKSNVTKVKTKKAKGVKVK
jgi:hypothetical protein